LPDREPAVPTARPDVAEKNAELLERVVPLLKKTAEAPAHRHWPSQMIEAVSGAVDAAAQQGVREPEARIERGDLRVPKELE
jgi:hypothetical protein